MHTTNFFKLAAAMACVVVFAGVANIPGFWQGDSGSKEIRGEQKNAQPRANKVIEDKYKETHHSASQFEEEGIEGFVNAPENKGLQAELPSGELPAFEEQMSSVYELLESDLTTDYEEREREQVLRAFLSRLTIQLEEAKKVKQMLLEFGASEHMSNLSLLDDKIAALEALKVKITIAGYTL